MGKLDGKVAVITGASSGIGLATTKLFVAEGTFVYLTGRRQKELDAAVSQIGEQVKAVREKGAGEHCQAGALTRLNQELFAWRDQTLG